MISFPFLVNKRSKLLKELKKNVQIFMDYQQLQQVLIESELALNWYLISRELTHTEDTS